jgi:hypothetical protein
MKEERDRKRAEIILGVHLILLVVLVALSALFAGAIASQVPDFYQWIIGLGFAIVIGLIASRYFLQALRHDYMGLPKPTWGVPPWLVGGAESLVFSVAVGASYNDSQLLAGVITLMGLWLGAKMLAGWNRDDSIVIRDKPPLERKRWLEERARGATSALLAGALNLAIAGVGGNIAAGGAVVSGGVAGAAVVHAAFEWMVRFLTEIGVNPS